jgi:2,3-bisphosphoglycerate-independent phosphoglycerate mutase
MRLLFLFMDGIGLGEDDPRKNPFAVVDMPNLTTLLGNRKLVAGITPLETQRATLLALDTQMGVEGLPQSATGQASILTGLNVPKEIGGHYGPKPDPRVREVIQRGTIFDTLTARGYRTGLLNAYPQRYFSGIDSGKRLYSAIPLAVTHAGLALKNTKDFYAGKAIAADFTGKGWREHLNYSNSPLIGEDEAGHRLAILANEYDFAMFDYWPSDYAGHHQDFQDARTLLESFDRVLGGLLAVWEDEQGLILITSDHGNLEDLSTRRHTDNPVPCLLIGASHLRREFSAGLKTLADLAHAILRYFP